METSTTQAMVEVVEPTALKSIDGKSMTSSSGSVIKSLGLRKNGKIWHEPKKAFRPTAGLTPYAKRAKQRAEMQAMKTMEKEMKAEKAAEREKRIQALKDHRAAKAEKERYELMAAKMHKKRVERLKRREKRNKMLNS